MDWAAIRGQIRKFEPKEYSGGYFILNPDTMFEQRIKNTLVGVGANLFLQSLFQAAAVMPANFYIGLTNSAYTYAAILGTVTPGEISTGGGSGYARQLVARSGAGWTVSQVNGIYRARSATVTFNATANWASAWTNAFLCDAANGNVGSLFAVSGPTTVPINTLNGAGPSMAYEHWLRG